MSERSIPQKRCRKCGQSFPYTLEYFRKTRYGKPGQVCRHCPFHTHPKRVTTYKTCSRCRRSLPRTIEYFSPHKRGLGGVTNPCRECRRVYDRNDPKRRQRNQNRNRERLKDPIYQQYRKQYGPEYHQRRKQNDPGYHRHKRKSELAPQVYEYKKTLKNAARRRRRADPNYRKSELERESQRRRTPEGRIKVRAKAANRRAMKRRAGGLYTAHDIELQIRAQTDSKGRLICWWCDKPIKGKYHIDHRIPLSRGGSNDARNLCITHVKCNAHKHDKLPHEYNGRLL